MSQDPDAKFHALVLALQSVGDDIGVYPAAVSGYNNEKDYKQRDGFKNGWNEAICEYGAAFRAVVLQATNELSDDLVMLLAADVGSLSKDGQTFTINFNDTWGWACADGEDVSPAELPDVARLFRSWGWAGLLYWATTKRPGLRSEFKDNNRFIDFVAREEDFIKAVPDSEKRAYMDLPPGAGGAAQGTMSEVIRAEAIARSAHSGQVEESTGDDYIHHVERVVALVDGDEAKAVAWLHDVLEDTNVTEGVLLAAGISTAVLNAVLVLTRGDEPYSEYIDIVREQGSTAAIAVKLADLRDHLRPNCPERLRPRYEAALMVLTGA